jgi:2-oxoglutarate dehydrogenase complex dehydrogenase (E1) component-like enzyme
MKDTKDEKYQGNRSMTHKWKGMDFSQFGKEPSDTGYDIEKLRHISKASVEVPADVDPHDRLKRMHITNRLKSIDENKIDWATAEAMAWGSLNIEGYNVRIVGEDSERGTFS